MAVETQGPVRTVIRAKGRFQAEDGTALCDYVARLHFYSRKPWARLQLTVVNHEKLPLSQGLATYPLLVHDLSLRVLLRRGSRGGDTPAVVLTSAHGAVPAPAPPPVRGRSRSRSRFRE